ncbi:MAG TPA: ribonuclease PH [Synergistales bacterium]|jgi:ribonuclease PH|nr:ribonuclease PH [Synergistales bacterium]HRV71597.1 ribonuclease PH [Thermovirgaceae bacterium]
MAAEDILTPRIDGRSPDDLREVTITRGVNLFAEGSARVSFGNTVVLCTASVEEKVPAFLRGTGRGWVSAEYSMLPRATKERTQRDSTRGRISGRSHEIQRLIGRSLRSAVDLSSLGERTLWIDCDVIQADGGTRTAAISGGFVALVDALRHLYAKGEISCIPLAAFVAAISVGKTDGILVADLCYEEDSLAEVDCNIVMNEFGDFIEVQGTAEGTPFPRQDLDRMLDLAEKGIRSIIGVQKKVLDLDEAEMKAIEDARDRICKLQQG